MRSSHERPGMMRMSRTTAELVAELPSVTRHAMRMSRCATGSLAPETLGASTEVAIEAKSTPARNDER